MVGDKRTERPRKNYWHVTLTAMFGSLLGTFCVVNMACQSISFLINLESGTLSLQTD